ncbi:MAG: hypothetical protein LWX83_19665 [Anaerolineae bacterium]|nr:hypothetical protein [Anaerolineae bacterium]
MNHNLYIENKGDFFSPSHLWRIVIVLLITLGAFGLRLRVALYGPVEFDEPVYMHAAIDYSIDFLDRNWPRLIGTDYNNEHPALFKLVYGAVLAKTTRPTEYFTVPKSDPIIGLPDFQSIFNLRMVSVVFGTTAVLALSLINPIAGLLLAVHTYAIKYSSVIYLEALPLLSSIICVFSFSKAITPLPQKKFFRWQVFWLLISALSLGVTVASKYLYGIAGIAAAFYALGLMLKNKRTDLLKPMLVWGLLAILTFVLLNPSLWETPIRHLQASLKFNYVYASSSVEEIKYDYPFWQPFLWLAQSVPNVSYKMPPFFVAPGNYLLAIDGMFLPLAILGLWALKRDYPIFFSWLILGFLFLIIWNTKWPQYIMMILPPYCLSAALAIRLIVNWLYGLFVKFWHQPLTAKN